MHVFLPFGMVTLRTSSGVGGPMPSRLGRRVRLLVLSLLVGLGGGLPAARVSAAAREPFYPNDPWFFCGTNAPLYPGQWHLVNQAPATLAYPLYVSPNGRTNAARVITNAGWDINVSNAWRLGYTGRGIVIGITDDGIQLDHPDLDVRRDLSLAVYSNRVVVGKDGGPRREDSLHGTAVAGMAAAIGGNGIGVTGPAPHAQLASIQIDFTTLDDYYNPPPAYYWQAGLDWVDGMDAAAQATLTNLTRAPVIQIKNCSSRTMPFTYGNDFPECYQALSRMAANGVLYTIAASNCRRSRQQDGSVFAEPSHPYAIDVAAMGSHGRYALYSSFGSCVFVSTLSESAYWNGALIPGETDYADGLGVSTTDRIGTNGVNYSGNSTVYLPDLEDLDYTSQFDGTSAAAPEAAGVLALAREANPNLGARMAKHLLARTSRVVDALDRSASATWSVPGASASGWRTNAAGLAFNPDYGFGLIDAFALVTNALRTAYVTRETLSYSGLRAVAPANQVIPPGDPSGRSEAITVAVPPALKQSLESVELYVQLAGQDRGEWQVVLHKDGTSSRLWAPANDIPNTGNIMFSDPDPAGGLNRLLLANAFWGETPDGLWTVNVANPTGTHAASWSKWGLILHMGEIVFEQPGLVHLTHDVAAAGLSLNQPASHLIVASPATFSAGGDVWLNAGELEVDGLLCPGAAVSVSRYEPAMTRVTEDLAYRRGVRIEVAGGVLSGTGVLLAPRGSDGRGGVFLTSGVLRPGAAGKPGTLVMGGIDLNATDCSQSPGSVLEITVDNATNYSRLVVNGVLSLEGKLRVSTASGAAIVAGTVLTNVLEATELKAADLIMDATIPGASPQLYWRPVLRGSRLDLVATVFETVPFGRTLRGAITNADQELDYRFSAKAGATYRIGLTSGGALAAQLNPGPQAVGTAVEGQPLEWTSSTDGEVSVRIGAAAAGPATGTFALQVYSLVNGVPYVPDQEDSRYARAIAAVTPQVIGLISNQQAVGGALALVDGNDIVWLAGFGYADQAAGLPYTADTLSQIGSVSKVLTAMAVMQLAEAGRVQLDHPLTEYVPEFSPRQRFTNSGPITVRSLLTHHSGIPADLAGVPGAITTNENSAGYLASVLDRLKDQFTTAPVGFSYQYCNTAYSLLGLLVARAAGEDFVAHTRAHLFERMNMFHSSFHFDAATAAGLGLAREYQEGQLVPERYVSNVQGAGSVYTTAADMARFLKVLLNHGQIDGVTVLEPETLEAMLTRQNAAAAMDFSLQMGLGWDLNSVSDLAYAGELFEKNGASPVAFCAHVQVLRDHGLAAVAIFNTAGAPTYSVTAAALKNALRDKTGLTAPPAPVIPESPKVAGFPQAQLEALSGLYLTSNGYDLVSTTNGLNGLLWVRSAHQPSASATVVLYPRASGWFAPEGGSAYQSLQMAFTNVAGYQAMLRRKDCVDAHSQTKTLLMLTSVKYEPPASIPAVWRERLGKYHVNDLLPGEYLSAATDLELLVKDNLLLLRGDDGVRVLDTRTGDDDLAFVAGVKQEQGETLRMARTGGMQLLQCQGRSYRRALVITGLQGAGSGDVELTWQSEPGQSYTVLTTPDLATPFTIAASNRVATAGFTSLMHHPAAPAQAGFYQVLRQ